MCVHRIIDLILLDEPSVYHKHYERRREITVMQQNLMSGLSLCTISTVYNNIV